MRFTSFFEDWLIPDGCYPPFETGMLVNVAFGLNPSTVFPAKDRASSFQPREDGTCRMRSTITGIYPPDHAPVVVLDSNVFRCYARSSMFDGWSVGTSVEVEGSLLVDNASWPELRVPRTGGVAHVFLPLRVERIRLVRIPERFIARSETRLVSPTVVGLSDVTDDDISEIQSMHARDVPPAGKTLAEARPSYFLVDFSDRDLPDGEIPRTFLD